MRDVLNPYRLGLRLIFDRLLWDIRPVSWGCTYKLKILKNSRKDEKAVILCNGPSLLDIDFDLLKNVYTFGLNKINLLFGTTDFRPSSIVAVNPFVLEQNQGFFASTKIPLFLDSVALSKNIPSRNNVILLHSSGMPYFSRDCSMSIFQGYTVTYVALQLAYHMGFSKVCLVGCDHNFQGNGMPNKEYKAEGDDLSHFSKQYFTNGQVWQYPDLEQSEVYYKIALENYKRDGRSVYNASTKTNLDVFPKLHLESFVDL